MQIVKKFLANGAIAKLLNNVYFTGRNAADNADVNILKVNASDRVEFASLPQATGTPSANADLTTKQYVDSVAGGSAITALTGEVTATGPGSAAATVSNAAVIAKLLTGYTAGAGSVSATDSILQAIQKVDGNDALKLPLAGGTMSGNIAMGGNKVTGLADPTSNQEAATKAYVDSVASAQKTWNYEALTLNGTDITNQYKDLAQVAITGSIDFYVNGVWQRPTTDYTINYTGGAGGKTRLTFAGDLATGGAAALVSSDVIHIKYQY